MGTSSTAHHGEKHMAWVKGKRTVYCRRCYEIGHNKRSCPQAPPEIKQRYKDGDLARKCSYCQEKGHTKRKCNQRNTDIANYVKENSEYRKAVIEQMKREGLSIGALVIHKDYVKDGLDNLNPQQVAMVLEIEWDKVQSKRKEQRVVNCERLNTNPQNWNQYMSFRAPCVMDEDSRYSWNNYHVISRGKDIDKHMPDGWLNGTSGVDEIFK